MSGVTGVSWFQAAYDKVSKVLVDYQQATSAAVDVVTTPRKEDPPQVPVSPTKVAHEPKPKITVVAAGGTKSSENIFASVLIGGIQGMASVLPVACGEENQCLHYDESLEINIAIDGKKLNYLDIHADMFQRRYYAGGQTIQISWDIPMKSEEYQSCMHQVQISEMSYRLFPDRRNNVSKGDICNGEIVKINKDGLLDSSGQVSMQLPIVNCTLKIHAEAITESGFSSGHYESELIGIDSIAPSWDDGNVVSATPTFMNYGELSDKMKIDYYFNPSDNVGVADVEVYQQTAGTEDWQLANTSHESDGFYVTDLTPLESYCFSLFAVDFAGNRTEAPNQICASMDWPNDPTGIDSKLISDFDNGSLTLPEEVSCSGSWSSAPESSCSNLVAMENESDVSLVVNNFRHWWYSFSLTTTYDCQIDSSESNYLEFDMAGRVKSGLLDVGIYKPGESPIMRTVQLRGDEDFTHVQIPLNNLSSFYKLAFWPRVDEECGNTDEWLKIDNVALTK